MADDLTDGVTSATFATDRFVRAVEIAQAGRNLRDTSEEINAQAGSMSPSTLSRILSGKRPDMETLLILCDWLGVSPAQFFDAPKTTGTVKAVRALLTADERIPAQTAQAFVQLLDALLTENK